MYYRLVFTTLAIILLPLSVAAADVASRQSRVLTFAAEQMKLKNYSAASRLAADFPEDEQLNFLMGVAELKRGKNVEAAELLGKAAKSYPLLADYALFYQAEALRKADLGAEAIVVLKALQKGHPGSPLIKKSRLMVADTLFEGEDYSSAESVYHQFIEQYPSGSDSLQASYRLAVCKEKQGNAASAAALFRSLWLNSPGSIQAAKADDELKRLAASGIAVKPYSSQELFKRAATLFEQHRYDLALITLRTINSKDESKDFIDRVGLKIGQALLKARRYAEAENSLKGLAQSAARAEVISEATYLMIRAIEKSGRSEEAFNAYRLMASVFPESAETDNALLEAAFIRKFQNRPSETVVLLEELLTRYPQTRLKERAIWESGWAYYISRDSVAAADQFSKLLTVDGYREKSLYWYGRSIAATGDKRGAEISFALLRKEFPFGFYALSLPVDKSTEPEDKIPVLTGDSVEKLPLPEGFERVKALISLGLMENASAELAASRKNLPKNKDAAGLARLYLELGNYNRAMSLFNTSMLNSLPENRHAWSFLYPKAFSELVSNFSEEAGVDPSLAFAVMRAESAFTPSATSPVGARGLMQLMPQTAAMVLNQKKIDPERLYDPELNIRLGTKHLRELIDKYSGNEIAVIASYNAGAGNVNRWLKTYSNLKDEEFVESIPFGETRDYVKKVLAVAALYRRLYGMQ